MPPRWILAVKQGLNMNGIINGRGNGWPGEQGAWRVILLLVLLSQTIMGCQAEEAGQEPVAVEVMRVGFDRTTDMPVVILRDKGETRAIPIWIGAFEARAIAMELEGAAAPRPLTHDLLKSILQGAGVVFEKVLVSELKERHLLRAHFSDLRRQGFRSGQPPQ